MAAVLSAGLLLSCGSNGADAADETTSSSIANVPGLLDPTDFSQFVAGNSDAPVVNVHIPYEGHIDGTDDFVPFEDIAEWDELPDDKSAPIALYCRSGNMSAQAAAELKELGYTNVVDLAGGMKAWSAAGMTVEENEPPESVASMKVNRDGEV